MKTPRLAAAAILAALSFSAHAVGHLADFGLYDRSAGRELPVYWHEGRAYVVGRPGNEYQVVVHSRQGEDLLAVVSVDGVNVVSGETASASQGGYVLSPWERLDIRGWRKSLGEIAAFYFTSLGDSYAARTGRPNNVGVIGVALFRRKPVEPPPPASSIAPAYPMPSREAGVATDAAAPSNRGETQARKEAAASPSAPLGTGHGRRETSQAQWTRFERASAEPVETIAIYYDSYRNLVARGIFPSPVAPRDPQPFPGFVRDPA